MLPIENSSNYEDYDQKEDDEPSPAYLSGDHHRKNPFLPS
jgi:hypothetical protein